MKSFHVSRQIPVSAERVWAVLTDAQRLASGALGITRIDGSIRLGEKLKLWTEATGARAFSLRVSQMDSPREMVWEGGMPLGLFRGVRRFKLTPKNGGVQFDMTEQFSGLMAPLISKSIPDLTPSFERFAAGLSNLAQKE
ncbi:MAG: SRPBCC family protein [Myxococcaceae bacterium]